MAYAHRSLPLVMRPTNTSSTVHLRPATPADLDAVHALRREFYREDGSPWAEEPARAALAALLAQPAHGLVWVACDDHEIVGFAALTFGFSLEFLGRDAFVDELFIRQSHRRRGLGLLALETLGHACIEHGIRSLHLEIDEWNEAARALYRRWGFAEHSRRLMTRGLAHPAPAPRTPAE